MPLGWENRGLQVGSTGIPPPGPEGDFPSLEFLKHIHNCHREYFLKYMFVSPSQRTSNNSFVDPLL